MSSLRLLVEWDDCRGITPNYGIVKANSLVGNVTNLQSGQIVFVKDNQTGFVRQARILKLSEEKNYLKQEKNTLDRESQNMKNFLLMFRRAFTEMKMEMTGNYTMMESSASVAGSSSQLYPSATCNNSSDSSSEDDSPNSKHFNYNTFPIDAVNSYVNNTVTNNENNCCSHSIPIQVENNQTVVNCVSPLFLMEGSTNAQKKLTADKETQVDLDNKSLTSINKMMKCEMQKLYLQTVQLLEGLGIDLTDANSNKNEFCAKDVLINKTAFTDKSVDNIGKVTKKTIEESDGSLVNKYLNEKTPNGGLQYASSSSNCEITTTTGSTEMVAIGFGNTSVPAHILNGIDWSSYTTATRKLLEAVFPRSTLATHSLTGKPSPAFKGNPGKKRLKTKHVDDIVYTVAEKCKVPPSRVRSCITIKCTDEARRYRIRHNSMIERKKSY